MIKEYKQYWVEDGTPTKEDIVDAVKAAKKHKCNVQLHWKGPAYRYYGDTYSRTITPDSNPDDIFNSLPKVYGV